MIGFAPAKVNVGLFITEKRSDGYHNLESVFWPIPWYDVLEVHRSEKPGLNLQVSGLEIPGSTDDNLIHRAYRLIQASYDIGGVNAFLLKTIPMGAGLGGGSSDGTCMLKLLNDLFELNIAPDEGRAMAKALGADCPFFWDAKPALVSGIGEVISSIPDLLPQLQNAFITVIHPSRHVSTAEAFHHITPAPSGLNWSEFATTSIEKWDIQLRNDFTAYSTSVHPVIADILKALSNAGADYAQMTGTGSAVYGIFSSQEAASAATRIAESNSWIVHCSRMSDGAHFGT